MSSSNLSVVEEVTVRLQRGKGRTRFERDIKAFLKGQSERNAIGAPGFDGIGRWAEFYDTLGAPLSSLPTEAQMAALREYGFRPIFLPAISEDQYPNEFVKPAWGKYIDVAQIKRQSLPGRLVAVEAIAKPNWDDLAGYPNDKFGKIVGLDRRFGVSYNDLHAKDGILAKVAEQLGLPSEQVRLPYAEEWNFAGNLFNLLRAQYGEQLPDLGSTNSWEWCENAYGSDFRLLVGSRGNGSLSAVNKRWCGGRRNFVGFRVLAVL